MKVVTRLLENLEAQMRRTALSAGVDAVHDLRIGVRRASQALRLFEDRLPPSSARRIRREIRAIRDKAAAVRDRDVTYLLLRRRHLPASDPACVYLTGQRDLAAAQLQRFLEKRLRRQPIRKWTAWLDEAA